MRERFDTLQGGEAPTSSTDVPAFGDSATAPTAPLAIRLRGVSKCYRLGAIGGRTLQHDLQTWWAARRGAEDPNQRIDGGKRTVGETFYALRNVSLDIHRGERVGIIGANGAGKSTLLKLLSRITAPTEGEIDLWGRVSSMLEVGTGFHREMTGRENVYLNGAILGMTRREIDARLEQIIAFSEIGEFMDTPVKRYSSGMFVKLAFAVAAHLSSEILIMDEVLAVGDAAFQRKCLDRMRQAADEEDRTVLYVSHNMDTIRRLCGRCIVLDEGRVIFDGDVEEGVAAYLGRSLGDASVERDLTTVTHARRSVGTGVRMVRMALKDKGEPLYSPGEPLRMLLRVEADRPQQNVSMRLTLRTESDVALGTAWSAPFKIAEAGQHDLAIELPLDVVAVGAFYLSAGLYRDDGTGRRVQLDHVTRAMHIEVQGRPAWSTTALGYLSIPGLTVKGDRS